MVSSVKAWEWLCKAAPALQCSERLHAIKACGATKCACAVRKLPEMPRSDLKIGLGQAGQLCNMTAAERLSFLSNGLPIILSSAQSLWRGSREIEEKMPREAAALRILAEEEAAKALVLMDAVRCPPSLIASRIGKIVRWFYDHLARLLYAEATWWEPAHMAELREIVDRERKAHYLDGHFGEYIMPNSWLYRRECLLYADIEAREDEEPSWSDPLQHFDAATSSPWETHVRNPLLHVEALHALGVFTPTGIRATSEIWGQVDFTDEVTRMRAYELGQQLVTRLRNENLPHRDATENQVDE